MQSKYSSGCTTVLFETKEKFPLHPRKNIYVLRMKSYCGGPSNIHNIMPSAIELKEQIEQYLIPLYNFIYVLLKHFFTVLRNKVYVRVFKIKVKMSGNLFT